jgi:hypothetical protein
MRQETAPVDSTKISIPQCRYPSFPIRSGSCTPATGTTAPRVCSLVRASLGLHRTQSVFAQILVYSQTSPACYCVKHRYLNSTYHLHSMLQCMLRIRLRTIRKPAWRGIESRGVRSIMAAYLCECLRRTCQMALLTARKMQEYRGEGLAVSSGRLDSKWCVTRIHGGSKAGCDISRLRRARPEHFSCIS